MERKTKKEIIEETAAFYREDPMGRRGMTRNGSCRLRTPEGRRCAVGRVLREDVPEDLIEALDDGGGVRDVSPRELDPSYESWDDLFREEYRGHEEYFWSKLQSFHDDAFNWDESGLTSWGEEAARKLLEEWGDK